MSKEKDMTPTEAVEELKALEYYCRPFDNSTEETNKANRKRKALYMAIQLLEKENKDMEKDNVNPDHYKKLNKP